MRLRASEIGRSVGQMVGRKGTTFWNSDSELEAGELEIAAHSGLST